MYQTASLKIICTDSTELLFSKLKPAGLNYHLPKLSFFTDPYHAGALLSNFFHSKQLKGYAKIVTVQLPPNVV